MMTSYDFMKLAKQKIAEYLEFKCGRDVDWTKVQTSWLHSAFNYHTGAFFVDEPDVPLFDASYNGNSKMLYLNVYQKIDSADIKVEESDADDKAQ